MKRIFFLFLLLVCFVGCKTTKYNTKTFYTERKEVVTDIRDEKKEKTVTTAEIELKEDVYIEEIITRFSLPDSTGKQYIVETVNRSIGKTKTENTNIISESSKNAVMELKTVEKTDIKEVKTDKTVVKTKAPAFVTFAVIGIVCALIIALFIFLKKYRIL